MRRRSLSARVRFAVLERDGFHCRYCGAAPEAGRSLHVDHVKPVVHGGSDKFCNLVTACQDCNLGKAALLLKPIIESQRSKALAAVIFDAAVTKFETQVSVFDFAMVHDFCLMEAEPDELLHFVARADTWLQLRAMWYEHTGHPEDFYEDVLG